MKTKILLLVVLFLPIYIWGQDNEMKSVTSTTVEVSPPEFTGIKNAAMLLNNNNLMTIEKYLTDNFVYPDKALRCLNQGTIIVQFVVNENGELADFNIINSVCHVIDKEFIEILKTTDGMWKPGYNNETPVPMEKEVSMMFVATAADMQIANPREHLTKLATSYWKKGAKLFLEKNNFKKAIKQYDQAIKYLPYDGASLLARGLCKYELGDKEGALADWERINRIGSYDASSFIEELAYLKGYDEMKAIVKK